MIYTPSFPKEIKQKNQNTYYPSSIQFYIILDNLIFIMTKIELYDTNVIGFGRGWGGGEEEVIAFVVIIF